MAVKIVSPQACISCGFCVDVCPQDVLEIGKYYGPVTIVNPDDCIGCGNCIEECAMAVLEVE